MSTWLFISTLLWIQWGSDEHSDRIHPSETQSVTTSTRFVSAEGVLTENTVTISGFVRDAKTGEQLIGANIINLSNLSGVVTNFYGYYALRLPTGSQTIRFSYIGYESIERDFEVTSDIRLDIELNPISFFLDEVSVQGRFYDERMSTIRLDLQTIKKLPSLTGEVDVIKSIQLLPGVQGGTEGTSGFFVRGGSSDQNLILIDGVPVYNVSHLFGFISIFNADAINNVELIKGGFPARYGGRLSSVLDIALKEGNSKEYTGSFTAGIVASKISLEGPIIQDRMSFFVTGRRSFLDPYLRVVSREQKKVSGATGGETNYFFYDLNAKINYKHSDRNRFYASLYNGSDTYIDNTLNVNGIENVNVRSLKENELRWGNNIFSVRWNTIIRPKLFANVTIYNSNYELFTRSDILVSRTQRPSSTTYNNSFFSQRSFINDWAIKADFHLFDSYLGDLRTGVSMVRHDISQQFNSTLSGGSTPREVVRNRNTGTSQIAYEGTAYVEFEYTRSSLYWYNVGLHANTYSVDSKLYASIQPRLSARYFLFDGHTIGANYVLMNQNLHLLSNSGVGLPTDLWISSSGDIKPQRAQQVGIEYTAAIASRIDLSIEFYRRWLYQLLDIREGANFYLSAFDIAENTTTGAGEISGVDVFIRKSSGKTTGWIGYGLSKSDRTFPDLNNGIQFPFTFDRRHDFSIVLSHDFSQKWNVSGNWIYTSGRAVTLPSSTFVANTIDPLFPLIISNNPNIIEYSSRNAYRFKPFHRMDLSVNYRTIRTRGIHEASLGIYNVYNRMNTFYLSIDEGRNDDGSIALIDNALFPLIPSISYSFTFNRNP